MGTGGCHSCSAALANEHCTTQGELPKSLHNSKNPKAATSMQAQSLLVSGLAQSDGFTTRLSRDYNDYVSCQLVRSGPGIWAAKALA